MFCKNQMKNLHIESIITKRLQVWKRRRIHWLIHDLHSVKMFLIKQNILNLF